MSDLEVNRELTEFKKEQERLSKELVKHRNNMAYMLLNGLGDDIQNVLCGKEKVKLSFWEKMRYKVKYFIDKMFKLF